MPYELCFPVAGLHYKHRPRCPAIFLALRLHHNDAAVPAEPEIPWRVSHPSTIQAQCCLTSVFKWELVYRTW